MFPATRHLNRFGAQLVCAGLEAAPIEQDNIPANAPTHPIRLG